MEIYGSTQPVIGPRFPHTPESVAAEIVPKMEAEEQRLADILGDGFSAALTDEQRDVVETQHRRIRSAIDRFQSAIDLLNHFDPPGD